MTSAPIVVECLAPRDAKPSDVVALPFETRSRSRLRVTTARADAVNVVLPRGTVLRGGDKLLTRDGAVIEVQAAPEDLLEARCPGPQLARVAYHLGNRHVSVEIGDGWLRFAADHVLEAMVRGLGVDVVAVRAPFEPESGAYSHDHGLAPRPSPRIHDFGHG